MNNVFSAYGLYVILSIIIS